MTATGHALVGTMIAVKFPDPVLALSLSFFSHFAFDLIPHWDLGTHWREKTKRKLQVEAAADVILGFILSFALYNFLLKSGFHVEAGPLLVFAAIIAAQGPDWITAPSLIFRRKFPLSEFMYKIQHRLNTKLDKPWGVITQILALMILYIVLFVIF
jgi:hypothetical protein